MPELVEDDPEAAGQGEQGAVAQVDERAHEIGPARPELETKVTMRTGLVRGKAILRNSPR